MGIFSKIKKIKPAKEDKEEKKPVAKKEEPKAEKKEEKRPEQAKAAAADKAEPKKAAKKEKKVSKGSLAKDHGGQSAVILMEPVLTEKAGKQEALGKYSFIVAASANKVEVAAAVRDLYGVQPVSVHIVNVKGKQVRFGRRTGQRKGRKKAIVTLKSGDAISLTE